MSPGMITTGTSSGEWWSPGTDGMILSDGAAMIEALHQVRQPLAVVVTTDGGRALAVGGAVLQSPTPPAGDVLALHGRLGAIYPEWLGERAFAEVHGCRFAYVVGEMARGIATARMAVAAAEAGFMGFFGSAGLSVTAIDQALGEINAGLGPERGNWGANLIHSPQEPAAERAVVDLFLSRGVRRVSASAFMAMSPEIVRYMARGLARDANGGIYRANHVFAKVSRAEVARHFMSPPPPAMLRELAAAGAIDATEAELAAGLPVAEDITAEADSGGHTDNRALTVLLPQLLALRDEMTIEHGYARGIRVGAAGGLGTPTAVAAAFAMGASYVLTGSINQAARESGLSSEGRAMLAEAEPPDVAMAPAADMFELGVEVQVLKRGTLFAQRGRRLYDLYRSCAGLDDIPADARQQLERDLFRAPLDEVWANTRAFFAEREPAEVERAEREPKHKMALVFRTYLFMGAQWAREGVAERRADYQIWCGPAMGAFNDWARNSFLVAPEDRTVVQMARNLMEGAAATTRAQQARAMGLAVPSAAFQFRPRPLG